MVLNAQEREALDAKLSPFKSGDLISDVRGDIIGVFDKVAYHGGNPEIEGFGNYIFVDFKKAISKKRRPTWHVFENGCGDDDVYIDRRKHDLSANYRFATEAEKQIFDALTAQKNQKIIEKQKKETEAMEEEKLCILMEKYIHDEFVKERFMAEFGGFITGENYVEEERFCEELRAFFKENPDVKWAISLD